MSKKCANYSKIEKRGGKIWLNCCLLTDDGDVISACPCSADETSPKCLDTQKIEEIRSQEEAVNTELAKESKKRTLKFEGVLASFVANKHNITTLTIKTAELAQADLNAISKNDAPVFKLEIEVED